jgi:cell division transport system permease protein
MFDNLMWKNKILKLHRTLKEGFQNFYRNGWLSVATITILTISLYIISITVIIGMAASMILKNTENEINVSIYFNPEVQEQQIMDIKNQLQGYQEIKSIDYVSKDQALDDFLKVENNDAIKQSLQEIGENPLLASLVIKANNPDQYPTIVNAIQNSNFQSQVARINYDEHKLVIERLNNIIKLVERVGMALGFIFIVIATMITFNAIRITMFAHRQEFEIMRLVGASNLYVEMPYFFQGIFYGVSGAVIGLFMIFLTFFFVSSLTGGVISRGDMMRFFFQNLLGNFGILLVFGIGLGVISSSIAIRRYLKK